MEPQEDQVKNTQVKQSSKKSLLIGVIIAIIIILGAVGYYFSTHRNVTVKTQDGKTIEVQQNGNEATIKDENGEFKVGSNVKIPANFSKNVPIYKGITLTSVLNTGEKDAGYTATTKDDAAKVIAWFRTQYTSAGWSITFEDASGINFSKDDMMGGVQILPSANAGTTDFSVSVLSSAGIPQPTN